jgi:hypothetical protein
MDKFAENQEGNTGIGKSRVRLGNEAGFEQTFDGLPRTIVVVAKGVARCQPGSVEQ